MLRYLELSLTNRGNLEPYHILHGQLSVSPDVPQERLKSRRPFVPAMQKILTHLFELGIRTAK